MSRSLDLLAESHGIQSVYTSEMGERKVIADEAKERLLMALSVDPENGEQGHFSEARQAPEKSCALPPVVAKHRRWGISCQLYGLRSQRNLGIGDYEDLARLAVIAAREGASFIGVNPLHALFMADGSRISPYSPSTRRFNNPLYLAIDKIEGGAKAIETLRADEPALFEGLDGSLVDYPTVCRLKNRLLRMIYGTRKDDIAASQAFERFVSGSGSTLHDFALFEAISQSQVADGGHAGWHHWPEALQDRTSDAVDDFERDNFDEINFHKWLQFEVDEQIASVQARAKSEGMAIGLYLDLAVGVAPDGAETWADPALTVAAARVGAPPDMFNSAGQDWGLAPLSPKALQERDYTPLRNAFGQLTLHAGAVRIDHAMGLARLWWIPGDQSSAGGGYVRYPLGEMVDAVAEASNTNHCIVIGEDLGTVPEGFRDTMEQANILSYRVLYFERRDDAFLAPHIYPKLALACISTHDLAPLAGWWKGTDIKLREEAGTQDSAATQRDLKSRAEERIDLLVALRKASLIPHEYEQMLNGDAPLSAELNQVLSEAVHRYVARTPSLLLTVQLEDMLGATHQPNLPGTTDQYPNWRIRQDFALEDLDGHERFLSLARAMREERPNPS
ncbi:putative 4-alpha-glucanotransferase [Fulvimarina pelagi HTCC2506]|uniref:4-alpha-glucanotransferase n=2 Tax=Fulvimarina pelagi TaxID=217511 RepID=Q0FZG7_9HYPH|nr:4-alpha-glucanotransferase [Fulvimarina pelagi]EAU40311.1 putative 4-alpha-glucanotransferase [Fulvimarina pelagi HTCC2506]BAT31348.1 putative 4-alpha-glucanotransferase [Fulvimarina pelagi]